jgi:hypothetical protein
VDADSYAGRNREMEDDMKKSNWLIRMVMLAMVVARGVVISPI